MKFSRHNDVSKRKGNEALGDDNRSGLFLSATVLDPQPHVMTGEPLWQALAR
ncbi:hypothetical protein [Pelobacter seleniigenes]|uniref:hypothetical protein n=1 Tax=Pelobacter seleniigenes TaxID=407188 RepID=UPI0012B8D43A|nr:hypothetical protein [Pelobacter seleniigenes]